MCEDPIQAERSSMISTGTHESQDLVVPAPSPGLAPPTPDPPAAPAPGADPDRITQGPVNAITVLTLLDKLVNMLDTVQENQNKMEVRQAEMEGAVQGIQADMTKLSKNHSHTSNTVSKLLDKSRKVSVTMKEVRDKMERQAVQVKKLEANHAHLLQRNNFKVLIFQEENEIPASVFVKEPVPYPRDGEEEGHAPPPPAIDANRSQEEGLHTIDLSSDEDVGLEAELEEEVEGIMDLEHMEKSRAEKIKRSSLKKVDSLKKAFSRHNIEKKMTKIGTKIVSQEQREKIKKSLTPAQKSPGEKTSPFKISPLTFSIRKSKGSTEPQPAEPQAPAPAGDLPSAEAHIELSPLGSPEQELPFTEVHAQLAPEAEEGKLAADAMEKEVTDPAPDSAPDSAPATDPAPDSAHIPDPAPDSAPATDPAPDSASDTDPAPVLDPAPDPAPVLDPAPDSAPAVAEEPNGYPEAEEFQVVEVSSAEEGLSQEYCLSATLPQEDPAPSRPQQEDPAPSPPQEEEEEEEEEAGEDEEWVRPQS